MADLNKLMQQAQEIQKRMQSAQEELTKMEVVGEVEGVKVRLTGRYDCKKVIIDPDAQEGDLAVLEDLVAAAFNDAVRKVERETRNKMSKMTEGMQMPEGLGNLTGE